MASDLEDTIVALSSASGSGGRAIVRLSGPKAFPITFTFFKTTDQASLESRAPLAGNNSGPSTRYSVPGTQSSVFNRSPSTFSRRRYDGSIHLPELSASIPASLLTWPAPRTYTGQDLAEFHLISSPPLVDLLITSLLNSGARAAQPGEFTQRAFLAGKLDLPRAEAVLAVIEAGGREELKQALAQLAGGVSRPLEGLREDLLDLLGEVEAGLDFAEEDIRFVQPENLLTRLAKGMAQVTLLSKQLDKRALCYSAYRVVLAGRTNAGKTSLFNALTGGTALVSSEPGTTRDYLVRRMVIDGLPIDLIDTAGWGHLFSSTDGQSQQLGKQQTEQADLVLLCLEAGQVIRKEESDLLTRASPPAVVGITTKCDLGESSRDFPATSAKTGAGLGDLRNLLAERARSSQAGSGLTSSLSRCRHHVLATLEHLRRAHSAVLFQEPQEHLALELRGALDELGALVGAVHTDDLLDRIFSRFCIGK